VTGPGRVLGVDLGTVRVGVAMSDSSQSVATPLTTLSRSGDLGSLLDRLVQEEEAVAIVVGLPLSLDGSFGPAALGVLDEVNKLRERVGVPVETYDERFTTVTASRALQATGRRGRKGRQVVDQVAAAVMLQAWLDAGAGRDGGSRS
jgi:putative holliday junction resolvase